MLPLRLGILLVIAFLAIYLVLRNFKFRRNKTFL